MALGHLRGDLRYRGEIVRGRGVDSLLRRPLSEPVYRDGHLLLVEVRGTPEGNDVAEPSVVVFPHEDVRVYRPLVEFLLDVIQRFAHGQGHRAEDGVQVVVGRETAFRRVGQLDERGVLKEVGEPRDALVP